MHEPKSYSYLTSTFFFLPVSSSVIVSLVIDMVSLGQFIWHSPQATHLLLPFSSDGITNIPRKRGDISSVALFSGYCSVTFLVKNSLMVVFIPMSKVLTPCIIPLIYDCSSIIKNAN